MWGFNLSKQKATTLFLFFCLALNSKALLTSALSIHNEEASFASSNDIGDHPGVIDLNLLDDDSCTEVARYSSGGKNKEYASANDIHSEDFDEDDEYEEDDGRIYADGKRRNGRRTTTVNYRINYITYQCDTNSDGKKENIVKADLLATEADLNCLNCLDDLVAIKLPGKDSLEDVQKMIENDVQGMVERRLKNKVAKQRLTEKRITRMEKERKNCRGEIVDFDTDKRYFQFYHAMKRQTTARRKQFACFKLRLTQLNDEDGDEFYEDFVEEEFNFLANSDEYKDREYLRKYLIPLSKKRGLPPGAQASIDSMLYYLNQRKGLDEEYADYHQALQEADMIENPTAKKAAIDLAKSKYKAGLKGINQWAQEDQDAFQSRNRQNQGANDTFQAWRKKFYDDYKKHAEYTKAIYGLDDSGNTTPSSVSNQHDSNPYDNIAVGTNRRLYPTASGSNSALTDANSLGQDVLGQQGHVLPFSPPSRK